ncbi:hypothetical protein BCR34DRAFT_580681 [Clohesyomyces aquaticus]|uniref:Uncharacterized protein n=1 Tax=Clohesyomyces aquaticus TaxID=1231657 RepID=A0A1Y1Y647_9PLEO|nr:hypothetical protein BCR34DRAFT_580681 [Clohesyomyces aquaticus]
MSARLLLRPPRASLQATVQAPLRAPFRAPFCAHLRAPLRTEPSTISRTFHNGRFQEPTILQCLQRIEKQLNEQNTRLNKVEESLDELNAEMYGLEETLKRAGNENKAETNGSESKSEYEPGWLGVFVRIISDAVTTYLLKR